MPQFLILANDYKDEDALNRRMAVREKHLLRAGIEKQNGIFITGGAKLDADNTMNGSMLLVEMENKEAVEQWVQKDPYVTGKVWEEIEIIPFKIAAVL